VHVIRKPFATGSQTQSALRDDELTDLDALRSRRRLPDVDGRNFGDDASWQRPGHCALTSLHRENNAHVTVADHVSRAWREHVGHFGFAAGITMLDECELGDLHHDGPRPPVDSSQVLDTTRVAL
jgi:hypothetical protein